MSCAAQSSPDLEAQLTRMALLTTITELESCLRIPGVRIGAAEVREHEPPGLLVPAPRCRVQDRDAVPVAVREPDGAGGVLVRVPGERHLHAAPDETVAVQPQPVALDDGVHAFLSLDGHRRPWMRPAARGSLRADRV